MPVCSTGISQPRSGTPTSIVVDTAYIQSILPAGLAWLYPYLPFMHGLQIGDIPTFCSVDPPTWSVPTGAEIYGFITGGPLGYVQTVSQFMQDITRAYLWYNICECASVATPAPPSTPAAPTDLPSINPAGTVSTPAASCGSQSWTVLIDHAVHISKAINVDTYFGYTGGPSESGLTTPVQPGAISVQATIYFAPPSPVSTDTIPFYAAKINFWNGITFISSQNLLDLSGEDGTVPCTIQTPITRLPGGTTHFELVATVPTGMSINTTGTVNWFCGSGNNVGGQTLGCCTSTDPVTIATLNQIVQMLTLLQRQTAPFAYVPGPVHSGLTGTGSFAVQGILGLHVSSTVAASTRLIVGTPDVHLELGRINLGTSDAFIDRTAIVVGEQLVIPAAAGIYTVVGYTLEPGVTIEVTELIREP